MSTELKIPDNSSEEERAMYLKLAKKFGLKLAKDTTVRPMLNEVKALKVISICGLCQTTSVEYFKLVKYSDRTWRNTEVISAEQATSMEQTEVQEDRVPCCPYCINFLMQKEKIELARMITKARSPIIAHLVTKERLKERRAKE